MADLSKLSVEQRSLVEKAQKDGTITPEERAEMERAGIAKEILDELSGDPGKIGDGFGKEPEYGTYFEEGRREAEAIKAGYRAEVRDAWNKGDYWTAVKTSLKGAMAPDNTHVREAGVGKALFVVLGAVAFGVTSCMEKDELPPPSYIHNETNNNINVSVLTEDAATKELINLIKDLIKQNADLKTVIEEFKNSNDENAQKTLELLQQLVDRLGQLEVGIDQIAQILFEQGVSLDEIVALLEASNKTQDDILNELSNGHDEIRTYLENILNAINNGNEIDANTNKLLAQLLEKVGNIEAGDNSEVLAMLEKIFALVQESIDNNKNMDDKTYALLETLVKSVKEGNAANAKFYEAILNKLDGLEGVMKDYLKNILDAVNANGEISEDIRNLTQKVLEQINNHAVANNDALKAILEAINNLSIGSGGNADLSKIEEMLAALLKETTENGDILTDINGKLDVINMTIKAATEEIKNLLGDKFDQNNEYFKQIIDKLEGLGGEGYDDTELLEKLDTILNILGNINNNTNKDDLLAKLDEILAAIKDHKVIVDVTGKITCDCNCGQNHEGIVGDLGDLLG